MVANPFDLDGLNFGEAMAIRNLARLHDECLAGKASHEVLNEGPRVTVILSGSVSVRIEFFEGRLDAVEVVTEDFKRRMATLHEFERRLAAARACFAAAGLPEIEVLAGALAGVA